MPYVDIVIVIVVGLGIIWGAKSGVARQVLGIAGLISSFILAFLFMEPVGSFLATQLPLEGHVASLAGFGAVFLLVKVVVMILIRIVLKMIGVLKLGLFDRMIGAAVGGLSAGLLLSIASLFMAGLGQPSDAALETSYLYDMTSELLPRTWDYVTSIFPQLDGLAERFGIGPEEIPEP